MPALSPLKLNIRVDVINDAIPMLQPIFSPVSTHYKMQTYRRQGGKYSRITEPYIGQRQGLDCKLISITSREGIVVAPRKKESSLWMGQM